MALVATNLDSAVPGSLRVKRITIALDNSYPNPAGYTLTAALFGFQYLHHAVVLGFVGVPVLCGEYAFNSATNNLQMLTSAGVLVANAVNHVGTSLNVEGYGN